MIRSIPFADEQQLKPGWKRSQQSAQSAMTYLGPDLIVQRRSGHLHQAWDCRNRILESISDPDGLLVAGMNQFELDEDRNALWIKYRRHDLPTSPAHLDFRTLDPPEINEVFTATLPAVLATESLLRQAEVDPELLLELSRKELGKGHAIRLIGDGEVREQARALGWNLRAPIPGPERVVLSHGDALGKNIIATDRGYRLIDWEALGLYRAGITLAHALSWNLLRLPVEGFEPFLDQHLESCLPLMEADRAEAQLLVYWQMVREALYWGQNPERTARWLRKAETLL
jgi:hypothetical protein